MTAECRTKAEVSRHPACRTSLQQPHFFVIHSVRFSPAALWGLVVETTTLNLLTRDGVVTILIAPALDNKHYSELHDIVYNKSESADDLWAGIRAACGRWGRTVHFDWRFPATYMQRLDSKRHSVLTTDRTA